MGKKEIKFRNLTKDEVEVRIGGSGSLLLYKTARVDAEVLDETVGQANWQKKFYQVKNTMICSVGININYDEPNKEPVWVWKDDAGDDDYTMEKVKAEASDSFKRAGFAWGIGRCLYYGPKMKLPDNLKARANDKSNPLFLDVSELEYDKKDRISKITITTDWGKTIVYQWANGRKVSNPTTPTTTTTDTEEEDLGEPLGNEEREFLTAYVRGLSADQYNNFFIWLEKQFGTRKIAELTKVQGKKAVAILKNRRK